MVTGWARGDVECAETCQRCNASVDVGWIRCEYLKKFPCFDCEFSRLEEHVLDYFTGVLTTSLLLTVAPVK